MSTLTEAIREQLMANDPEYQRLREEHARYVAQLEQLTRKTYLNEAERMDEIRLKKLKLRAKDQMEMRVRQAMLGAA